MEDTQGLTEGQCPKSGSIPLYWKTHRMCLHNGTLFHILCSTLDQSVHKVVNRVPFQTGLELDYSLPPHTTSHNILPCGTHTYWYTLTSPHPSPFFNLLFKNFWLFSFQCACSQSLFCSTSGSTSSLPRRWTLGRCEGNTQVVPQSLS